MLVESVSIFAIILCIIVIFVRSGHRVAALGATPLLIVPGVHAAAYGILHGLLGRAVASPWTMLIFADIAAVLVSGVLLHLLAQKIRAGKTRQLYIVLLGGYNVILACAFVYHAIPLMA